LIGPGAHRIGMDTQHAGGTRDGDIGDIG